MSNNPCHQCNASRLVCIACSLEVAANIVRHLSLQLFLDSFPTAPLLCSVEPVWENFGCLFALDVWISHFLHT